MDKLISIAVAMALFFASIGELPRATRFFVIETVKLLKDDPFKLTKLNTMILEPRHPRRK